MNETYGDIFDLAPSRVGGICICTNGIVRNDGTAIMGAGIAKQAATRWPAAPKILGALIRQHGNITQEITTADEEPTADGLTVWRIGDVVVPWRVYALPTKKHWSDMSDLKLIVASLVRLRNLTADFSTTIALPRPGCLNGGLDWLKTVKPICEGILASPRFLVVERM